MMSGEVLKKGKMTITLTPGLFFMLAFQSNIRKAQQGNRVLLNIARAAHCAAEYVITHQ